MRLGDVLSSKQNNIYKQVDSFLGVKNFAVGAKRNVDIGQINLSLFCQGCGDVRPFISKDKEKFTAIKINDNTISINCVLTSSCSCKKNIVAWFLIESENDMFLPAPFVRILKHRLHLPDDVSLCESEFGNLTPLFDKAEKIYLDGNGAGAIVYLRMAFEKIVYDISNSENLTKYNDAARTKRNFANTFDAVEKAKNILPSTDANNGRQMYNELSAVIHGECDEETGIQKYEPLKTLIIGIINNMKTKEVFRNALNSLGLNNSAGGAE